jgi:hypothetical protein
VALKLDFRKAFDSIEWQALDTILEAKNFAPRWRQWVQDILNPSQTAVLLNGTPGKWINCMKGLRQGDPLSPHLFILVADVLQQLIIKASANGIFEHPISTKELLSVDSLVKKQRAFLWTGEDKCHGSQCKVAWDDVCLPKDKGGLGVPDLTTRNKSPPRNFCSNFSVLHRLPR